MPDMYGDWRHSQTINYSYTCNLKEMINHSFLGIETKIKAFVRIIYFANS